MKRLIFTFVILAIVATLSIWGDRIAGRVLDRELPPLLTRELGLPVTLAPIKANLWRLKASSQKLVMGDPADPAVIAHDVEVTLALSDLIRGEVRLVTAAGSDLMVRPSRWPSSGNPLPDNYRFLDPWLPKNLRLEKGAYVMDDGSQYPVRQAHWKRPFGGGATASWLEDQAGGEVELSAKLESLRELLNLAPLSLDINLQAKGNKDSAIALQTHIKPDDGSGYVLDAQLQAAGTIAHITTGNNKRWSLPDHSTTKIDKIVVEESRKLLGYYTAASEGQEASAFLASTLPRLSFIDHQGNISIDEILLDDEKGKDTVFDFKAGPDGLKISSLSSKGPSGIAVGNINILSGDSGWKLDLSADMQPRQDKDSIAAQYLGADWLWHAGHTELHGSGKTWGALLDALQGNITLEGLHRGETDTPVKMQAHLGNHPDKLTLDQIDIIVGGGHITGSMSLSGTQQRLLTANIDAHQLDLHFLYQEDGAPAPGMAVPAFLYIAPRIELNWTVGVHGLRFPGLALSDANLSLQRKVGSGKLAGTIVGPDGGNVDASLDWKQQPDTSWGVSLSMQLDKMNIPASFEQASLLYSRSTGSMEFHSQGHGIVEIFQAMQGDTKLSVEMRAEDNWERAPSAEEKLQIAGKSTLVMEKDRILGVEISDIDIDSTKQDITGKVSLVSGRSPWLIAQLKADKLDIKGLRSLMPETTDNADDADLLKSLQALGSSRFVLDAKSVVAMETALDDLRLEMSTSPSQLKVDRLDFTFEGSPLTSKGAIEWGDKGASFTASAQTSNFDLDKFLLEIPQTAPVPVSGSASIKSEGSTFSELLSNLSGDVLLKASKPDPGNSIKLRRHIEVNIHRLSNGMHADIKKLQLGSSDLTGSVRYLTTSPPLLEIEIGSGSFSLEPWELQDKAKATTTASKEDKSLIGEAAQTSAKFVGSVLSAPSRFLMGPGEAAPGEKYFSSTPLAFDKLNRFNATLKGRMDALTGLDHVIEDLSFDGKLQNGQLALKVSAGSLNGGKADMDLAINNTAAPPAVTLNSYFEKVGVSPGEQGYPKSGVVSLHSVGNTTAELASNLNGRAFMELGEGPFDYSNLTLLSADVGSKVLKTLIPGLEKSTPRLECGLTMAQFKDGKGITPYGYALRTNQANLIGRIQMDLKTEMMQIRFDSRSREGVGLSVGNVFSNTVQVKGPLTDPEIVPNTTGMLWRGWAAFMTAGLSVVGESVLKRALASENPCEAIRKDIQKDVCGTSAPLASSPLVCPAS